MKKNLEKELPGRIVLNELAYEQDVCILTLKQGQRQRERKQIYKQKKTKDASPVCYS